MDISASTMPLVDDAAAAADDDDDNVCDNTLFDGDGDERVYTVGTASNSCIT
jgi:hypothetical protein